MRRAATALILIPSVIYVIFWGPLWLFQMVVAVMGFLCFHEFASIATAQQIPVPMWLGQTLGLVFLFLPVADWRALVGLTMALAAWSIRTSDLRDALPLASVTLLGILYVYGAWRCAPLLRDHSPWWLMFGVSINWVGDTAALYVGKAIGKHKLAPVISPGKTWEGAVGSAVFSTAYGALLLSKVVPETPVWHAALLSFAACVAGQLGDLVESAMKRGAGVKDSGHMLPGHGGWLDRLDSTLFSMPVVAFYLSRP